MALHRVTDEQLDYPGDGLYYLEGQPFTGVVECRLSDSALVAESEHRDGLLWGRKRSWHPSGGLELDAECAWGGYHGRVREWYEDGRLAADLEYEYGVRVRATRWDEQGWVVEEFVLTEGDPAYHIVQAARAACARHSAGPNQEHRAPAGQEGEAGEQGGTQSDAQNKANITITPMPYLMKKQ